MDKAKQHWEILRRVPDELARRTREFMVIGKDGEGVILLTDNGDGYWLGKMDFREKSKQAMEPTRLDVPNLASMAQGHGHILLLNKRGQIYAMGKNQYGQLGLGTVGSWGKTCFSPKLISIQHKFVSVRCGSRHSVALTEDGKVWAWGWDSFGQVGVASSTDSLLSPHQIPELDPHRVVAVECGGWHSLALTDRGEVYAWGWNECGQLGYGSKSSKYTPTRILTPSPVKSMAAGNCHTLLLTQTGEVYACGENGYGQLGLPTTTKFSVSLVKVTGLPSISQIASHFHTHISIAMSAERQCFTWGQLVNIFGKMSFSTTPIQLPPIYSTLDSVLSFGSIPRNTPCSVRVEGPRRTDSETQTELLIESIQIVDQIARMFDNPGSNPDVKFQLGDQSILAHRCMLQIFSAHFDQFFSESSSIAHFYPSFPISKCCLNLSQHLTYPSEPNSQITPISSLITIPIADHCYPTFYAYLHFLYTENLQVPIEHLIDLYDLAHSHFEFDLELLCLVRMRTTLSPENCCLFYQLTERHRLPEFQQDILHFIADNRSQVISSNAYRSLNAELSKKLTISSDNLRR